MTKIISVTRFVFILGLFVFCGNFVSAQDAPSDPWSPAWGVDQGTGPIILPENCTKPVSEGGWGGYCGDILAGDGCWDWFGITDDHPVGYCDSSSNWRTVETCCVKEDPNPKPAFDKYIYSYARCTGVLGGTCEDWPDLTGTNPCAAKGMANAGLCNSTNASIFDSIGTWDNACCIPRDGEVFKELCAQSPGNPECTAAGLGETKTLDYGEYTLLETLPGSENTSGDLQSYLETLYKVGLILITLSAVFMLVWGGFVYMTAAANTALIKKAKSIISDAIIGLIIALVAWLILYIINPNLVNLTLNALTPVDTSKYQTGIGGGGGTTGTGGGSGYFAAQTSNQVYTDAEARSKLSAAGISVNKANCSSESQTNCTSLDNIPTIAIAAVIALKQQCKCEVVVTGGTEAGHSTHGENRAALDIRRTEGLNTYLRNTYQVIQTVSGRPVYGVSGARIWDEDSSHFHAWIPK